MTFETWIDVINGATDIKDDRVILTVDVGRTGWTQISDMMSRINGTWDKKQSAFIFPFNPKPVIDLCMENGTLPVRNKFAYFPTSRSIMDDVSKMVPLEHYIKSAKRILEPNAGTGHIAKYIRELMNDDSELICCEIDDPNIAVLRDLNFNVVAGDFFDYVPTEKFDLIVMNPPFQSGAFIKHIRHAQSMLTDNGILLSIMPEPWLNKMQPNQPESDLRNDLVICNEYILREYWDDGFENTNIRTACGELRSVAWIENHVKSREFIQDSIDTVEMTVVNDSEFHDKLQRKFNLYDRHGDHIQLLGDIKTVLGGIIPVLISRTIAAFPWLIDEYAKSIIEHFAGVDLYAEEIPQKEVVKSVEISDNMTLLDFMV